MKKIMVFSLVLLLLLLSACSSRTIEEVNGLYEGETPEAIISLDVKNQDMALKFQLKEKDEGISGYGFLIKDKEGKEITKFSLPQIEGSAPGIIDANLATDKAIERAPQTVEVTIGSKTYEIPLKRQ